MKDQKFGVEIEMTGLTRARAAKITAEHFGTESRYIGQGYDAYGATDNAGRTWKFVSDSSIRVQGGEKVEMVTPICEYADIEVIQEIVRKLRAAGAKTNDSCGIHVHVNAAPHTARTLKNITNIIASKEDILYKALNVLPSREHFCKKVDERFVRELNARKPTTLTQVQNLWYGGNNESHRHYASTRYHGLNLHAVFNKGTVEFRLFNGTLHAGKIKAYIQLCLAVSQQALKQKRASVKKTVSTNEKYTFRTWLLHLGLIGDEFKTARLHLLANLTGDTAFRYGHRG